MDDVVGAFPRNDRFSTDGFLADLAIAAQKDGVKLPTEPGASELLSAAFRQSNSLGSTLASQSLGEFLSPTADSPAIDPDGILTGLKSAGLGHHANLFTDVATQGQFDARIADLKRELADRQTLQASGGLLSELAMGVIDPVNLLPFGAGFTAARTARGALKVGAGVGATSAAAQEAVLQQAQVTRTWEESLTNVAASTVFGAGLGLGGFGLHRLVGAKVATRIMEGFDEASNDLRTGGVKLEQRIVETAKAQTEFLPGRAADDAAVARFNPARVGALQGEIEALTRSVQSIDENASLIDAIDARLEWLKSGAVGDDPVAGGARWAKVRDALDDITGARNTRIEARIKNLENKKALIQDDVQNVRPNMIASLERARGEAVELAAPAGRSLPFVADTEAIGTGARSAGAAAAVEPRDTNVYSSSDRIDARLAGVPVDKLLKNFGKALRKVPYIGDAIAQGLRNPRLELQDSISPTARNLVNRLDENPYILRSEAAGEVRSEGVVFSEVFSKIEGGHATAIKEIGDIWKKNSAEFDNDRAAFGARVYFAAINNGVDEGGNVAVQKAANVYRHLVFNPIQKLFTEAGLLKEGVNVKGAESYTPWVHRAEAIIEDKENFLSVHSAAFREQLEREWNAAVQAKTEHLLKTETEALAIEAGRNVKIAEVRKKFEGDRDTFGKIKEAEFDKDRVLGNKKLVGELKLEENAAIEKAAAAKAEGLADGRPKQAVNSAYNADLRRIAAEFAEKRTVAKIEADRKIAEVRAARDAEIKKLNDETKTKLDELRTPPNKVDRELLKLGDSAARDDRAEKLAKSYYDGATSGADHLMLGDDVSDVLLPSVLKARKSPILQKHSAQMGWAETNIFDLGDIYHRGAGAAAAMGTVFKKTVRVKNPKTGEMENQIVADINLTEALKQVAQDFDAKINAITGKKLPEGSLGKETPSGAEIALRQAKAETIRNIEIMRDGLLGRRATFGSKALQETADLAMQFNSWRLMGGSVLSSLGDPMNIAVANGFGKSWANGLVPAFKNFKAFMGKVAAEDEPAILRMNRLSAAVVEREKNSFMAAMMDLHNPGANASQAQIFARNVSKRFWNWSGLTAWTQFWKNVEAGVTHARIIDAATRGADKLSQPEIAWLTNLRIDGDVLARIAKAHAGQAQKHSAGIPYGAFDEWTDKLAASRFADALSREAKNVIVTPSVGDKLAFQHTPFGQMAGQFRSYGISATGKLVARNAALAGLDGDKTGSFYTGLFMIGLMGVVVDGMKFVAGDMTLDGSSKRDPSRASIDLLIEKWAKTPGEQAYNALDRTGVMMPLTEPSNILQKLGLPNLQGAFSLVARDDKGLRTGSSRFMHRSVAEAALGPSMGLLEDTAHLARLGTAFGKYMVGMNEDGLKSSDFSKARRLFIGQNVPGIQQGINTFHQKVGTIFDWPTP